MEFITKFKNYLLSQKNKPSEVTVKNYAADINQFIAWFEHSYQKAFQPQEVSIQVINEFKKAKLQSLSASSVERHISSLRKFFTFLKLNGDISSSPFDQISGQTEATEKADPWHIRDFKNYLYIYNASHLTIKNYLIDVKQFLTWAETVLQIEHAWNATDKNILIHIDDVILNEYKQRLMKEGAFSPASINRKLSSLRKYFSWAAEQGYMTQTPTFSSTNILNKQQLPDQIAHQNNLFHNTNVENAPIAISSPKAYSNIPPIRLIQKIANAGTFAFDMLITSPTAFLFRKVEHGTWLMKGKPLFKAPAKLAISEQATKLHERVSRLAFKPAVKNISKNIYAPLSLSTRHFPWYKKLLFHARYTRPTWYHRYHQLAIAHYFNWAVLIIFSAAIGFGMYNSFVQKPNKSLAALPTAGKRILSFQGRLTDASDNPITTATWVRFVVYNDSSATGSARLWEEVDKVTPDQDGIFSLNLGSDNAGGEAPLCNSGNPPSSPATGACGIPQSLFAQNSALWLGVTVEFKPELTPREQIATVAYAVNSETLQGLPPITQTGAGTTNVVLALNSTGNLSIGGSTQFQATSGSFTLSGNTLVLNTNSGTNGNITLRPDGLGFVDIQRPLQNNTNYGNIPSAIGAVEIDDLTAILATSSGQSALTIDQNGIGPIISASHSGTAEFTLDSSGNGIFNGNVTGQTVFVGGGTTYYINNTTSHLNSLTLAGSFGVSGNVASDLIPSLNDTYSLGSDPTSGGKEWLNLYAKNIYSNGVLLGAQYFQRNAGVLSPLNITDDLAIGGTATGTAKFQIFGLTGNATTSGNLTFDTTGVIQTTKNQQLTLGGTSTGNIVITPQSGSGLLTLNGNFVQTGATAFTTGTGITTIGGNVVVNGSTQTVGNAGDFTIQTTTNGNLNLLSAGTGNIALGQNAGLGNVVIQPNAGGNAALVVNKQGPSGDILTASASGATQFTVTRTGTVLGRTFTDLDNTSYFLDPAGVTNSLLVAGTVGIGTTNPLLQSGLDIEKNALGNAALVVANLNLSGDLFTASNSAGTKFTIANDGTIKNDLIPNINNTYSLGSDPTTGGKQWLNIYGQNIYSNGQLLTSVWQRNLGVLSPLNITDDVAIGGTSTSSAKFQVFGLTGNATTSGSFTFNGTTATNLIAARNGVGITIGDAQSGNIILAPQGGTGTLYINGSNETVGNGSNYTIQTNTNGNLSLFSAGTGNITLGQNAGLGNVVIQPNAGGNAALTVVKQGPSGDILTASASATTEFTVTRTGNVLGRTFSDLDNSSYFLDPAGVTNSLIVAGTVGIGTTNPLSQSGLDIEKDAFGNAALVVNQNNNVGPIFTASSSGQTRFTIRNDGTLVSTKYTASGGVFYTDTNGVFAQASNASANTVLHGGATPSFSAVDLSNDTTGTLPINKGGTNGTATPTNGQVAYGTGTAYAFTSGGSTGNCLTFNSGSAPTWASCATGSAGTNYWQLNLGAISPIYPSVDLLVGSTATTSAKFAVTGIADALTPAASVSATVASGGTGTGIVVKGDGSIQSLENGTLTLGGNTTGNITLSPQAGSGFVTIDGTALKTTSSSFDLINTTATTVNFAGAASTLNIGAVGGTATFKSATIDDNQATLSLFATPTSITFGGAATTLNIGKSGGTTTVLGAETVNGNTILGTNASNTVTLNGLVSGAGANSAVQPVGNGTTDLGSAIHYWGTVYANNFISPVAGGTSGFWQLTSNVLSPVNFWNDLAIGGNATGSATPFQVFATPYTNDLGTVPAGTATTAGNLTFRGTSSTINLLNGTSLTFKGSGGGDLGLTTIATLSNSGSLTLAGNLAVNGGNITTSASTGNIFTSSVTALNIGTSGTTINLKGDLTFGTNSSNIITFNSQVRSSIFPSTVGGPYDLGATNNRWGTVYANNLSLPVSGGTGGFWTLSNSVLSPTNNWNDLAIGGTATSSATAFQVFANAYTNDLGTVLAGTATTSGGLTFRGSTSSTTNFQANLLFNSTLGFYNSVGGDKGITTSNPALYISNKPQIGIGTNNLLATLDVRGNLTSSPIASFSGQTSSAAFVIDNQGTGDYFDINSAGKNVLAFVQNGSNNHNALVPGTTDLYDLGSNPSSGGREWDTLYVRQIISPSGGGVAGYWQLNNGLLSPANLTNDLGIGGSATNSAAFQVFATSYTNDLGTIPAGTATTSGNFTFRGTAGSQTAFKTEILNGASLGFYTSPGGDKGITTSTPSLYLAANGTVQIGTASATATRNLDVWSNTTAARFTTYATGDNTIADFEYPNAQAGNFAGLSFRSLNSVNAKQIFADIGTIYNNLTTGSEQGSLVFKTRGFGTAQTTERMRIDSSGNVAIGTSSAQGIFDVVSGGLASSMPSDLTLGLSASTNWVANPSFEFSSNPVNGWTPTVGSAVQYSASVATESAVFGSHALKFFTVNSGSYSDASACIPILPSTQYNLSAYIYRVSGYSGNTSIDWLEYSGVNCTTQVVDGTNIGTTTTNTWTRVNESFTTGASTKSIQVRAVNDGSSIGRAYFDGFQLERGITATPYLDGSLGPGYSWDNTGAPNATDSSRLSGAAFAYQPFNSAGGIGAASRAQFPTLQLDQNGTGDIIAASASGQTQFKVTTSGNVYARQFTDLDNSIYYLDPAGLTISASIAGSMTFTPASEHDINFLNNSDLNFRSSPGGDAGLASRLFVQGSTGRVGIGTTSPFTGLEIASNSGALETVGSPNNPALLLHNKNSSAFNEKAELQFSVGNNNSPNAVITAYYTDFATGGGPVGKAGADLAFSTKTAAGALTEAMRIKNNGNVGIGSTSPNSDLTLGSTDLGAFNGIAIGATANRDIRIGQDSTHNLVMAWKYNATAASAYAVVETFSGNNDLAVQTSGGDFGVGLTNPSRKLDVTGDWGGNTQIDTVTNPANGSTRNATQEQTAALGYYLSADKTSGNSQATVDFNITGISNTEGSFFFVHLRVDHTAASGNLAQQCGRVKVNTVALIDIMCDTVGATTNEENKGVVALYLNSNWTQIAVNGKTNQAFPLTTADLAEWIKFVGDRPQPGSILEAGPKDVTVQNAHGEYNQKTLGIVSTRPNTVYGQQTDDSVPLTLTGRVPTFVTSLNGPIDSGDSITTSPIAGIGMMPSQPTQTVGKALESFDPANRTDCVTVSSYDAIVWPEDDGTNQHHPCFGVPVSGFDATTQATFIKDYHLQPNNIVYVGKIMTLVEKSYVDPQVYLTTTGDFHFQDASASADFTVPHYYTLSNALGAPLTRMGAFLEIAVGNLRAGVVNSQQLFTNSLAVATSNVTIAGQSLHDYIASVVNEVVGQNQAGNISQSNSVKTNIISPLDNSNIALRIKNSGIEVAKDASSSAVASIDNNGNATFSGSLNSQNLAINGDATVSGTLHATNIEANTISGLAAVVSTLSAQNITNVTNIYFATPSATPIPANSITGSETSSSQSSQLLGGNVFTDVSSFSSYFAYVPNLKATTGIFTDGLTSLGPTSLTDTTIEGQLSIGSQLILADTSVNVLGADFAIQPLRQGGVNFEGGLVAIDTNGNLTVNGNAMVKGNLAVGTLSPLAGQDFSILLNNNAASGSASPSFNVKNASGSAVFAISQLGDVVASGTANINKLNFNLVQPALAVSDIEVKASGSAGTAFIKAHQTEVTIDNPNVTNQSLIYITPVGTNQTPYLERQVSGKSFTVGIPTATTTNINFNWLIVN